MKNILIAGAGMFATDLIAFMLKHSEEYNCNNIVGNIDVISYPL